MQESGKIVIAYISIGEAENYRFYWNKSWDTDPPDWIGKENPEWEGNYPVKYWFDEWKQIIFEYLDKIIEQGFDGIYLDKIDSFEYWSDVNNGEGIVLSEEDAANKMIQFVLEIANYVRVEKGITDFYIIPQNGENILDFDENGTYLDAISGIGIEDLFYNGLEPIPPEITNERIYCISKVQNAGKRRFQLITQMMAWDFLEKTKKESKTISIKYDLKAIYLMLQEQIELMMS